jgi:hypothetical protein
MIADLEIDHPGFHPDAGLFALVDFVYHGLTFLSKPSAP